MLKKHCKTASMEHGRTCPEELYVDSWKEG